MFTYKRPIYNNIYDFTCMDFVVFLVWVQIKNYPHKKNTVKLHKF